MVQVTKRFALEDVPIEGWLQFGELYVRNKTGVLRKIRCGDDLPQALLEDALARAIDHLEHSLDFSFDAPLHSSWLFRLRK